MTAFRNIATGLAVAILLLAMSWGPTAAQTQGPAGNIDGGDGPCTGALAGCSPPILYSDDLVRGGIVSIEVSEFLPLERTGNVPRHPGGTCSVCDDRFDYEPPVNDLVDLVIQGLIGRFIHLELILVGVWTDSEGVRYVRDR